MPSENKFAAFSTMLCGRFPESRARFGQAHHITAIIDDCKSNITKTKQQKPTIDGCGISNFCHLSCRGVSASAVVWATAKNINPIVILSRSNQFISCLIDFSPRNGLSLEIRVHGNFSASGGDRRWCVLRFVELERKQKLVTDNFQLKF